MPLKETQSVIEQIPDTDRSPHIIQSYQLREAAKDVENRDYEAALEIIEDVKAALENALRNGNTKKILESYGFIEEDDYSITYPKNS